MYGEVVAGLAGFVVLAAPHKADLVVEGDDRRDVVGIHGGALKRGYKRLYPPRVVAAHGVGDVNAKKIVALGVGGPELARRVPSDRDCLRATLCDGHRKAPIERVALGRGIVGVAREARAVLFQVGFGAGAYQVKVGTIPKGVGSEGVARVYERARITPRFLRLVVAVDMVLLGGAVEEHAPPGAVVEP